MTITCPATGKQRHPDREAALTALRRTGRARHARKTPRQIYRCELCDGGWHTTSMSRKQWLMWPRRRPTT